MRLYLADQLCDSCILISAWWLPLCFVRTFDNLVADIQHFLFIASLVPKVQYPWRHIVGEVLQPKYIIHKVETLLLAKTPWPRVFKPILSMNIHNIELFWNMIYLVVISISWYSPNFVYTFSLHWLIVCHPSSISEPMFENLTDTQISWEPPDSTVWEPLWEK